MFYGITKTCVDYDFKKLDEHTAIWTFRFLLAMWPNYTLENIESVFPHPTSLAVCGTPPTPLYQYLSFLQAKNRNIVGQDFISRPPVTSGVGDGKFELNCIAVPINYF